MPHESGKRSAATEERRQQILAAALLAFTVKGYTATTIEDIRERSGASTGSIYHHFGSKKQVAAALLVDGLGQEQRHGVRVLQGASSAEAGVRAFVTSYFRWVEANPLLAAYLLASRTDEVRNLTRPAVEELNRAFRRDVREWLRPHIAAGEIRELPIDLYHFLWLAPAQDFARSWLAKRTQTPLAEAAGVFADAAWTVLRGPAR